MTETPTATSPADLARVRSAMATDPRAGLAQVHDLLRGSPSDPVLLRLAAAAHRALGERMPAERAEIAALEATRDTPAMQRAAALVEAGEFGEASRVAAEILRYQPDDLGAITLSAESALALGLPDKAIPLLEEVLARAPSYLLARTLLINALTAVDRLADARILLDPIVARMPDAVKFQDLQARIAVNQRDYETAIGASAMVARLAPDTAENWVTHGDTLRFAGLRGEAQAAYRRALACDPAHGRAWWSLADLDAAALDEGDVGAIAQALDRRSGEPEHLCNLHFARAIAADARGDHGTAFAHFAQGNAARRQLEPDEDGIVTGQVDRYLDRLTAADIPSPIDPRALEATPIFIVGMPRSGSTLVERILGRHSQIEALGELPIVPHMVERLRRDDPERPVDGPVMALPPEHCATMGRWYVARASELLKSSPPRPWFTDKMHMNWRHLPLILRMLPQARIIDVRRDALDCCWSNFRTLFARGHAASNDLAAIGTFYRDYARFCDRLCELAPERIHLVCYEDVLDDLPGTMRRATGFLGLDYEPAMADFHLSQDPVATASSEQVRQPLNRRGVGTWRPYAEWLDPLRSALGPLAGA